MEDRFDNDKNLGEQEENKITENQKINAETTPQSVSEETAKNSLFEEDGTYHIKGDRMKEDTFGGSSENVETNSREYYDGANESNRQYERAYNEDTFSQSGQTGYYQNYQSQQQAGSGYQDYMNRQTPPVYGEVNRQRKQKNVKKKPTKALAIAGFAVLFGVVSGAAFLTVNYVGNKTLGIDTSKRGARVSSNSVGNVDLTKTSSVITSDVSSMVEEVMPSIVSITNMSVQQVQHFFGGISEQTSESAGSGIIISQTEEELLIITNYHVIADSDTLTVTFADGQSVQANVKGTDATYDLAVIAVQLDEIEEETMDTIAIATLGDSSNLKVGEPAIAIGNALGYGQSVTTGVISALDRETMTTDEMTGQAVESGAKMIQTDAAINPGNSGGALLNAAGEVIGINSAKLSGEAVEGMGYAIPISDVEDIIDRLMNQETRTRVAEDERGYLGITGFDVTAESAERFHMPKGVYVDEVAENSGAKLAGITRGNIITGFNDTPITEMAALQEELTYYSVGETVDITIQIPENNGEYTERTVEVILGPASN